MYCARSDTELRHTRYRRSLVSALDSVRHGHAACSFIVVRLSLLLRLGLPPLAGSSSVHVP